MRQTDAQQIELFPATTRLTGREPEKLFDRLFFALVPDPRTAGAIEDLSCAFHRDRRLERKRQEVARQHVSLLHVGDYPRLRAKHRFAAELAARRVAMPAFDVTFDALGSFAGPPPRADRRLPHPLVLQARGSDAQAGQVATRLCRQLHQALGRKGPAATESATLHLTLSYGPETIPRQAITPIRFTADEFVLVHSEVGLTRHHVLGRWPLDAAARP